MSRVVGGEEEAGREAEGCCEEWGADVKGEWGEDARGHLRFYCTSFRGCW